MYGHSWKKVIFSSFALGVAGILTCISALLSDLVPTWSVLAFIAVLIPLGLAIVGILAGFVWICDKCEEYFNEKKDKLLEGRKHGSSEKNIPNDQKFPNEGYHRYIKYASLLPSRLLDQYTSPIPSSGQAKPYQVIKLPTLKTWHGQ
ncbi:MAG: hypothetical protein ABSA77_00705 [Thermoguttaceae bacterium]|jgi:hypothetical protein